MKLLILSIVVAAALTSPTFAEVFRTTVLSSGDPALTVNVPDARALTVVNYFSNGTSLSTLSVTKDGKNTVILYPIDISVIGALQRNLVVAGPASVTVTVTSSPVVFTYRIDPNTHHFANQTD